MPVTRTADIGPQYQWNREEMYSSGAWTLADLLERIPGTTSFRTGWLASPKFVAVNGDLSRVRIFYDGLEIDNLDTRSGRLIDLNTIELWTLENVCVERFGSELRVNLRTWKTESTNPYTRTDIYTGDEDTNIYRGFYGKRWGSGFGLQLGGQQWSTRSNRFGGGGDALSFMARAGIARKNWSIDGFATRRNASRVRQGNFNDGQLALQPFEGTTTIAYARAAFGNQTGGPWLELIASNMRLGEESDEVDEGSAFSLQLLPDTVDTATHRIEYVAAAGFNRGPLRASIADRVRAFSGDVYHSPEVRLEVGGRLGIVDVIGEKDGVRKIKKFDASARFTPLPFIAIGGGVTFDSPDNQILPAEVPDELDIPTILRGLKTPKSKAVRVEAGIRLRNPWLFGGYITRDTALLEAPSVIDTAYNAVSVGKRSGFYGGIRGKLYKDVNIDVVATQWDSAGFYQPRTQSRSELNLDTRWRKRFPSGSFGLKLAAIHEYRSVVRFPTEDGPRFTASSNIFSALVEIRILRGVATYQLRNAFAKNYQVFPGFFMHRALNIYGLRWEFWN
ncbi:MAG TPA: TonB-dependent receptor [Gemmatimonadaceae bacterium]